VRVTLYFIRKIQQQFEFYCTENSWQDPAIYNPV
jgi:hypothetical protein